MPRSLLPGAPRFTLIALFLGVVGLAAPTAHANGILISDTPEIRTGRRIERVPPVVLRGHAVTAEVDDAIALVTVEQVFHNNTGRQLEGTYLFPLPEGAVVSKFAMTMGGKMVQGEVMERNEARRIYESIVARQRDPGLLEYMGRGLFRARVFPIMPHADLTIRISYQQVLSEDAGTLEFRYPLATDRLNSSAVQKASLDIKVRSSVDIKTLYSPSHAVEITRDGERAARVSYERSDRVQDKDLLLYIGRSPDRVGFSVQSHKEVGLDGTFMTVFAPRVQVGTDQRVPKDVVYVVDKSGSMAGPKMEQAQKAIQYGVRMLRAGDRFNVLAFSTELYPFREGLVEATGEMKEAAVNHVAGLEAAGGTNIDGALQRALAMRTDDRLFLVVFITDGKPTVQETNPDKIVANVKSANSASTRVFTFGVGYDLDVTLLDRIAEITNGTRDYVSPGEDLEIVTSRFFKKVDQPVMSNLAVEFGEGVYDVYPKRLPDLFAGGQIVLFGRYKAAGDRTILLRGRVGEREHVYEHNATLAAKDGASYLPRLWAHRKVAFLLDEIRLHGENRELVDEVVKLATRHAIVTPYTAGLVVEDGEMVDSPTAGAEPGRAGWDRRERRGLDGRPGGAIPSPRSPAAEQAAPGFGGGAGGKMDSGEDKAKASAEIARLKKAANLDEEEDAKDGLDDIRALVKAVDGKTFVKRHDGVWVDKAYDGKAQTRKIEAWSEAYFELLGRGDKVAKLLALGEQLIFVLGEEVIEIVPAPAK